MKYLVMCEGPNELEIIRMLLEHDKLIFTEDDLLNLVPYHARQIASNPTVKAALNLYHGEVKVLRIGDKLNDELKIPKEYKGKIKGIEKYCTKPELEMLLIISEGLNSDFEKEKSKKSPKSFSKENVVYNRTRYDNSTAFYRDYYGKKHLEKKADKQRTHHLCNMGGAIQSISKEADALTRVEFYSLMEQVFALSAVQELVAEAMQNHQAGGES